MGDSGVPRREDRVEEVEDDEVEEEEEQECATTEEVGWAPPEKLLLGAAWVAVTAVQVMMCSWLSGEALRC